MLAALLVLGAAGAARPVDARAQSGQISTNGPFTATVGQTITMAASINTIGTTAGQYFWNFGDGTSANGQTVQKTYNTAGTFPISVQVQSNQGLLSGATTATVSGQAGGGQVTINGPFNAAPGQTITMTASLNTVGTSGGQYFWNFGDGTSANGQTVQKIYNTVGSFPVSVQIQTSQGILSGSTTATISGQAGGGQVAINGPFNAAPGQTITMSATLNLIGAFASQYFWNFGDGTNGAGQTVSKAYTNPGTYQITVQVQTTQGFLTGTTTATIGAQTTTGQVSINGPFNLAVGQTASMTATLLMGASASQYFWNFGDGTTANGQTVQKAYNTAGTYTITVQAQTAFGSTLTGSTTANVGGTAAGISAGGPYSGVVGFPVSMTGSATSTSVSPLTWTWNFGDGTSASGQTVQKTYTTAGTYTVTLQVQQIIGPVVSATANVTINAGTSVTESVALASGCNNIALTWPSGTALTTVVAAVNTPGAVAAIWHFDAFGQRFRGFSPTAPSVANDLTTINRLEAVFICLNAPATIARPTV